MNEDKQSWHVDKKVPLALIVTIIIQTSVAVWFVANLDNRIAVLERDELRTEGKVKVNTDAIQTMRVQSARQAEKLSNILRTVTRIDTRLERSNRP
ncbi:MAG: hypothetical protein COB84_07445 [Rhodobacteraceae bacterium]|nr:MAG: hypothetical protein COB84_07445 [Paracoccaceae bacterium]